MVRRSVRHSVGSRTLALVCAVGVSVLIGAPAPQAQSLEEREKALAEREAQLEKRERELAQRSGLPAVSATLPGGNVLPDARPGQCYAKVLEPAKFETIEEKVIAREASSKIDIVPAKYELVEEKVLVKEASNKLVPVPAVYETVKETVELEPARTVWKTGTGRGVKDATDRTVAAALRLGLPASPKPGACFAEFREPAQFETKDEKVLIKEASSKIEVAAAKYELVEEKVLVKQAAQKLVEVPAVYETKVEKVQIKPATTTWKKGRGLIERVDHVTGEIMCLVEEPAQFKTVKKRVLKSPATTKKVEIPAQYITVKKRKLVTPASEKKIEIPAEYTTVKKKVQVKTASVGWRSVGTEGPGDLTGRKLCLTEIPARTKTVTKRVLKTPATTKKVDVPAEYRTVKVRKLVSPAQEKKIEIPAEFRVVPKRKQVADEKLVWKPVLCETNATPSLITDIQNALKNKGFNPGPVDGAIGRQTLAAVDAFQRKNNLARGGLTVDTIQALGVRVN